MKTVKKILYLLIQCTWGLPQTLIGLGFYLKNRKCEHGFYRCSYDTKWNYRGGISLGLFIFTPTDAFDNAQLIRVHEYGHTIQSLLLGPLMLFIGIISCTWGNLPYFEKKRREEGVPYTACFVEAWASKWGELAAKEPAIWQ